MIQIEVDGFSGPLDLLCHMIESRELDVSRISVAQIVRVYGAYHSRKGELPIEVVANFLLQAASLVLEKAIALAPRVVAEAEWEDVTIDDDGPHENLEGILERYKPYRKAAMILADLQIEWSKRSFRSPYPLPPRYDICDLYSLSSLWWGLMKGHRDRQEDMWPEDSFAAVPPPIPEEIQVERRMDGIMAALVPEGIFLSILLKAEAGVSYLIVTILALLELSRKDIVRLEQKEMFGDVCIYPQIPG